jgi:hypothetical protein
VRFLLAKGFRKGPQDHMDLQIDTNDLVPGAYELLISKSQKGPRTYLLTGQNLEMIEKSGWDEIMERH